jgi:hypothetical protein
MAKSMKTVGGWELSRGKISRRRAGLKQDFKCLSMQEGKVTAGVSSISKLIGSLLTNNYNIMISIGSY